MRSDWGSLNPLFVRVLKIVAIMVLLLGTSSCDGTVRARFKVLSTDGFPLSDALVRLETTGEHDLASFTGESGCTGFGGTVAPYCRHVTVSIQKVGYQSLTLEVPTGSPEDNCFLIHLAPASVDLESYFNHLDARQCPCAPDSGYPPTMMARFKVRATNGTVLGMVEVSRSDKSRDPFAQVTDDNGCLGVSWIIPAYLDSVPLVLYKSGYQPAYVKAPILEDLCYEVILSQIGDVAPSVVTPVPNEECECKMFSGNLRYER